MVRLEERVQDRERLADFLWCAYPEVIEHGGSRAAEVDGAIVEPIFRWRVGNRVGEIDTIELDDVRSVEHLRGEHVGRLVDVHRARDIDVERDLETRGYELDTIEEQRALVNLGLRTPALCALRWAFPLLSGA